MSKPVYRSVSVERHLDALRTHIFDAAVVTTPCADTVLAHEPPWRRVTAVSTDIVDTYEVCVAIVEVPVGNRIVSVSAVVGPEASPNALDGFMTTVGSDLGQRADAIVAHVS